MSNTSGPIFKGQPSPGLKRMRQMSPESLEEHLTCLRVEVDALERRLSHLQRATEGPGLMSPPPGHINRVTTELKRLRALIEAGRRLTDQDETPR